MNPYAPTLMHVLAQKAQNLRPSKELAQSFEAIVSAPSTCGGETGPALKWARCDTDLAPLLPTKNADVIGSISLSLLPWGLRQPWANDISISQLLAFWNKTLISVEKQPQPQAMNLVAATSLVLSCVQDTANHRPRVEDLCREWLDLCDSRSSSLWKWDYVEETLRPKLYSAWMDLGSVALPHLHSLENPKDTLDKIWVQRMRRMFRDVPPALHSDVLLDVLTSSLPDALKRDACKSSSAQGWLNPDVHAAMRPLLEVSARACYQHLPWTLDRGTVTSQQAAALNERVAHLYCPDLAPAFSVMLQPGDWNDRAAVQRAVHVGTKVHTTMETLDISNLVV